MRYVKYTIRKDVGYTCRPPKQSGSFTINNSIEFKKINLNKY